MLLLPDQETGECPVTKQPLSREDLLPVKTNKVCLSSAWAQLRSLQQGERCSTLGGGVQTGGVWRDADTVLTRCCASPTRW